MRTEIREVTPALAQEWLDARGPNRSLKPARIAVYASAMKAGQWRLTHQGIAFDEHGRLIDGQNRLAAIIEAGVTVRMLCTWGLDAEAILDLDIGIPRTVPDCMKIHTGESVHTAVVALCNAMRRGMLYADWKGRNGTSMTAEQFVLWREEHRDAIDFAVSLRGSGQKVRGTARADVGAVIARAFYHASPARVREFFEIVVDPKLALSSAEPGASAALQLNQFLISGRTGTGTKADARNTYAKTARALKSFLEGRPLGHLYAATTELFPLPSDKISKH